MPLEGGFYNMGTGSARLEFPNGVWTGARDSKFRFIADVHTVQGDDTWTMVLRNPNPLKNANNRIMTPSGDSGSLRYIIDFSKTGASHYYYLLVREGGAGKIRFNYIRIERIKD